MSEYHILSGQSNGNGYNVVFHVPVPNANNDVGANYRTALTQYRKLADGTYPKSVVPFILAAEQTQLDNGELIEETVNFETNPGQTLTQNRDSLDALYNSSVSTIQAKWQNILRYWGYNRDTP